MDGLGSNFLFLAISLAGSPYFSDWQGFSTYYLPQNIIKRKDFGSVNDSFIEKCLSHSISGQSSQMRIFRSKVVRKL